MIPSDLHIAVSTHQFPIFITLALSAALDNTLHLLGLHTLSACGGLRSITLALFSNNAHPLADMTRPMTSSTDVGS